MRKILIEQRIQEMVDSPEVVQYYIDNKCKKCQRKGYILRGTQENLTKNFCECVLRNVRKEIRDVENATKRPKNEEEQEET